MTNTTNIPEWVQAAIAKLNEKHDEKRQQFKQQGNRYHDGFADGLESAETIFMREFERAETQSGWISVADRLPENGTTVLCLLYNKEIISEKLDNTDWVSKYTKHLPVDDNYVEYWQPLPQPPKQEHEHDK